MVSEQALARARPLRTSILALPCSRSDNIAIEDEHRKHVQTFAEFEVNGTTNCSRLHEGAVDL